MGDRPDQIQNGLGVVAPLDTRIGRCPFAAFYILQKTTTVVKLSRCDRRFLALLLLFTLILLF